MLVPPGTRRAERGVRTPPPQHLLQQWYLERHQYGGTCLGQQDEDAEDGAEEPPASLRMLQGSPALRVGHIVEVSTSPWLEGGFPVLLQIFTVWGEFCCMWKNPRDGCVSRRGKKSLPLAGYMQNVKYVNKQNMQNADFIHSFLTKSDMYST